MSSKSNAYWRKREAEALKGYIKDEKEYDKQVKKIYQNQLDAIQTQINAFYGTYAAKEGITIAEAKKRVSKLDIAEYERKAAKYVKEKDFSAKANEEMRLYNATMKINRLEMLKANIGLEMLAGTDELDRFMSKILKGRTEAELKRQAGILGKTIKNNARLVDSVVNASFHNATFSDRIWTNQALLRNRLSGLLQSGMIQGKNPRVLARDIKKAFNSSTYDAERLMRTELARVQTEAAKQSFEQDGFDQYEFIANSSCCGDCQALNGKIFEVKKIMPGENAAPIHPNCRCAIAPYNDRAVFDAWLDHLEKGGTTDWETFCKASESGQFLGKTKRIGTNDINTEYIKSPAFRNKFSRITGNTAVNEKLRQYAEAMLEHRKGTDGEDLYIISSDTGELLLRKIGEDRALGVTVTNDEIAKIKKTHYGKMIAIHNHPTNVPPTGSDFSAAGYRGYKFGLIITHSGRVFKYECGKTPFHFIMFDKSVDKYVAPPYNMELEKAYIKVLTEFEKEYGISWKEL